MDKTILISAHGKVSHKEEFYRNLYEAFEEDYLLSDALDNEPTPNATWEDFVNNSYKDGVISFSFSSQSEMFDIDYTQKVLDSFKVNVLMIEQQPTLRSRETGSAFATLNLYDVDGKKHSITAQVSEGMTSYMLLKEPITPMERLLDAALRGHAPEVEPSQESSLKM